MELLKLENNQHGLTRKLWEHVFQEDGKAFLDYYYFLKTRDNQIYVIEEDGDIRSMLHLNPYQLCVEDGQFSCNYIIAVATEEAYRKRGYMGKLLVKSMLDMYGKKEPFTFLMPVAEAIYTPYDFRFVYGQVQNEEYGVEGPLSVCLQDASISDTGAMAEFFNENFSKQFQVCTVRDERYYQTMIFEQASENGGIKLLKKDNRIVGMYAYAKEGQAVEIREPLYLPDFEEEFCKSIYILREAAEKPAKVFADRQKEGSKKVPVIMVRILNIEVLLNALKVKNGEQIHCSFAVLDAIITKNSRVWRLTNAEEDNSIHAAETEDSEGVLTIGALTSFLFGYKTLDEISSEEDVFLPELLKKELNKIELLKKVFLNEIV